MFLCMCMLCEIEDEINFEIGFDYEFDLGLGCWKWIGLYCNEYSFIEDSVCFDFVDGSMFFEWIFE